MFASRMVIVLVVGLAFAAAVTPVVEADHRCYTIGSPQVCRYIPGDRLAECLLVGPDTVECLPLP